METCDLLKICLGFEGDNVVTRPFLPSLMISTPSLTQSYFTNHPSTEMMPYEMQQLPPPITTRTIAVDHNTVQQQHNDYNGKWLYTNLYSIHQ